MNESTEVVDASDHPLATQKFVCPSEPMNRVCSSLRGAIEFNMPSLVIAGERRFGKTTTVRFIAANPVLALDKFYPTVLHRCRTLDNRATEAIFHTQLLHSLRHPMATSGTSESKFKRLINKLDDIASTHKHKRLLFCIDEAHRLNFREYNWLISLHNEVEERDVKITYALTGQPELANRRDEYLHEDLTQITGRFMAQHITFSGLLSEDEVRYSATQMDETLIWPANAHCYSEFFAPAAYRAGWRYADHSKAIWDAFSVHSKSRTESVGISMQSFVGITGYLFRAKTKVAGGFKRFSKDDIKEAVEYIAYLESRIPTERD